MATWEEDENEICNDDGFIYKRRKRQVDEEDDEQLAIPSQATSAVVVDLEVQLKQRKKKSIAKTKDEYMKEILQWELYSNTLRALEQRTQQRQQQLQEIQQASSFRDETAESSSHNELIDQSKLDELLLMVDGQAALIQDMNMLCNEAEAICKAEEERVKKIFFDLPICENPKTLLSTLCDDDNCNDQNAVGT
ncbi:hypothetical protein AQUCO_01100490v1 [Aquilegia coerulea]|uniref:Uncharacterized protein n=1 Tax=Aquilegia coerulea TaxID=218851 RepID=A0A2G5E7C9_AQUCA|nr:hypothetical protein AQUCO_01100490v1 [Aquilegia coerulea]